jgi:HlyD family secretion protein
MKKKIIIAVAVIAVLTAGFFVVRKVRGKTDEKPDRIEVVRRGPFVVKLNERGNLEPLVKVEVRSNVEGEIEELYVDEGYDVVKSQKLLKIDEKQIREEYNQSLANYNAAESEVKRVEESSLLNSDKLKSDILLAESVLNSAEANLEETKARAEQQMSQARISISNMEDLLEQDKISLKRAVLALEQAKVAERTAKARLDNAKAELDRKKELYNKKFVSLQEVENAQLTYSSAQSQYESSQNDIQSQEENIQSQRKAIENREKRIQAEKQDMEILKESLDKQKKQSELQVQQAKERLEILKKSEESEIQIIELAKASAEANLLQAKSMLNRAQERLDWTTILAPMTGRIVQCQVEEGEIITSGRSAWSQGPPVMIIADLSKMIVKTYVHEFDIGKIEVGQKAEIEVSAYPNVIFEGEVREISPSGQFIDNVIKFEVMVMVTKAPEPLMPGMTADVDLIVDERDNVLQLPIEAVNPRETLKVKTHINTGKAKELKNKDVKIAISEFPDKKFDGVVVDISSPRTGFSVSEVTIVIKGLPRELQPETSRTADLIISDDEKIPHIEASIDSEKEYFVKLVKNNPGTNEENKDEKNGELGEEEKMIQVGERNQNSIEILDGLKEGDKIRVIPIGGDNRKQG